jgi:hypothetical protein
MNQETKEGIELLEKVDKHIIHHTCGYTVTQDLKTLKDYVQQALALLRKEQPPAGEFTERIRDCLNAVSKKTNQDPNRCTLRQIVDNLSAYLREACAIIDSSEASRKELVEACESIDIFLSLDFPKMTPTEWAITVGNLKTLLVPVIAKAKKEGGE